MSNQIEGLLTQKPSSPVPQVGETKRFSVIPRTSAGGKAWNKVKGEGEGYGQPYQIVSVKKTDFVDSHGNVSFNVTLAPQNGSAPAQAAVPASNGNGSNASSNGNAKDEYWTRREARDLAGQKRQGRAHAQEMALRFMAMRGPHKDGGLPTLEDVKKIAAWFENEVNMVEQDELAEQAEGVDL
jgi:hypothetical protein